MQPISDTHAGPVAVVSEPGKPAMVIVTGCGDMRAGRAWLARNHAALRAALEHHGAVYLRGLPIRSVEDFATARDELIVERALYQEKATPRSAYGNDVFSSTDLPAAQAIRLHNENSYTLTFPGILLFCCLTAPREGGATPVADCRKVLADLPPELVARFRGSGWELVRTYSEHISLGWRAAFGTESADDVARYCAGSHITHEWCGDDGLRTRQTRSAIIRHPRTREEVWFNHAAFWNEWALDGDIREILIEEFGHAGLPFNTGLGDGTPLTQAEIMTLNSAYERSTVREAWRPGDLLMVDNVLTAHGRDTFRGDRRIVVAMGEPVTRADCEPAIPAGARR